MSPRTVLVIAAIVSTASIGATVFARSDQRAGSFVHPRDHAAIGYSTNTGKNVVTDLIERVKAGRASLTFDQTNGYLRALLDALSLPIESQVLVFSETSFQASKINRRNPRAVYFNDRVAVGFVRGGDILEIAAFDPTQGTLFYQLPQKPGAEIARNDKCLSCHLSWDTRGVPGPMVLTVMPRKSNNDYANGGVVAHFTPIEERWGGWYVTGERVPTSQLGNIELLQPNLPATGPVPVKAPRTVDGLFDLTGFPTPYSDAAALMVLEHQAHAMNLLTRAGWEYRVAGAAGDRVPSRTEEAIVELVDYLFFVGEASLPSPIHSGSGFAARFAADAKKDSKGRSLRDLQLQTRLMRYPLSYLIYAPSFEGLPKPVKDAVFAQISLVLRGTAHQSKYAHLTPEVRAAIREILLETLPASVRHFL